MTDSTLNILEDMDLYGAFIADGDRDTRPAPDIEELGFAAIEILDIAGGVLANTCFEDEIQKLLYSLVYVWHRRSHDINRQLDRLEPDIAALVRAQDGSEVKDLELQRVTETAKTLQAKAAVFDHVCDIAATRYEAVTGFAWTPPTGSKVGFDGSAAILDAADFRKARDNQKNQAVRNPDAPIVVFSGGQGYRDHGRIFRILDAQLKKTPTMVLACSAQLKGADAIAMAWARNRKVDLVKCLPNKQYGKRAGFLRNRDMLQLGRVIGVVVVKGSGVQDALLRDARAAGLKVKAIGFGEAGT